MVGKLVGKDGVLIRKEKEMEIPKGWEQIEDGRVQLGDKYWTGAEWYDAHGSIGDRIMCILVIRKKPEIPKGWFRVTEGYIKIDDKYWCAGSWLETVEPGESLEEKILIYIRKKKESVPDEVEIVIPEGWFLLRDGEIIKTGDKYLTAGQGDWCKVDYALGHGADDCRVVIRKPPEGWVLITDGFINEGDKYLSVGKWCETDSSGIKVNECHLTYIRKQDPMVPDGYELVTDGLIKKGDLYQHCNSYGWVPTVGAGERISDSYGIYCRKTDCGIKIPQDWYQVYDGLTREGDKYWCMTEWLQTSGKGQDIARYGLLYIRKQETEIPQGWFRLPDDETVEKGDRYFRVGTWHKTGCEGKVIDADLVYIRKQKTDSGIPDDWYLVTEGLIKDGDKFMHYGSWIEACAMIGKSIYDSYAVIRCHKNHFCQMCGAERTGS